MEEGVDLPTLPYLCVSIFKLQLRNCESSALQLIIPQRPLAGLKWCRNNYGFNWKFLETKSNKGKKKRNKYTLVMET